MARISSFHRQDSTPENTGDLSFVRKIEELYLEISWFEKESAWNEFQTRIRESLSSWSMKEVSELNNLPWVQNPFVKELELMHWYFTENDWAKLANWYRDNRGTWESSHLLDTKFQKYKLKYQKKLQEYLWKEYQEVLQILTKRAHEYSIKISDNSSKLLKDIEEIFPVEVKELLKIKVIKDAHARNAQRDLRFDTTNGLVWSINKKVKNALKWWNKAIKSITKTNRRILWILLLWSAIIVWWQQVIKTISSEVDDSRTEDNDTLVLTWEDFSKLIKREEIPWGILSNASIMKIISLWCDIDERKWWEYIVSFPKVSWMERYKIKENCTLETMKWMNINDVRFVFEISQKKSEDIGITLSIKEVKNLLNTSQTKTIITKLSKYNSPTVNQVNSILNASRAIRDISLEKSIRKETMNLILYLTERLIKSDSSISENSWKLVINTYEDYLWDKNAEKFNIFSKTLTEIFTTVNLDTIPDLEWPKIKWEDLIQNELFQNVGMKWVEANFYGKLQWVPLWKDEIKETLVLLTSGESDFNPNARNKTGTSASWLFQILQSHMERFGWGKKKIVDLNPIEQARIFNKFIDRNFEYQWDNIREQVEKYGLYVGWMWSAHVHSRWASEPRLKASWFDNFPQFIERQEEKMNSPYIQFSSHFRERIRVAKEKLKDIVRHTKNIPQSMETPLASNEITNIIPNINIEWFKSLRPTSGVFVKRSPIEKRTQIGWDGPGKEHYWVDLVSDNGNTILQNLIVKNDWKIHSFSIKSWWYGNVYIETKRLNTWSYLIAFAAHLTHKKQEEEWHIGNTGHSTWPHLHLEFFIVDRNGEWFRIWPAWSGTWHIEWENPLIYVKNPLSKENAWMFYSDIFPKVREYFKDGWD